MSKNIGPFQRKVIWFEGTSRNNIKPEYLQEFDYFKGNVERTVEFLIGFLNDGTVKTIKKTLGKDFDEHLFRQILRVMAFSKLKNLQIELMEAVTEESKDIVERIGQSDAIEMSFTQEQYSIQ